MEIFNLPDLGEGLPDAEIHEWFVKEGDEVKTDQLLVSMETAKAVVDVPCPHDGIIAKLYGKPGDIIKTGSPLVAYQQEARADKGTVVGNLEESHEISADNFTIGAITQRVKTTPQVRILAKKLGVELSALSGSGLNGLITKEDVERSANQQKETSRLPEGFEPLRGVRRAMLSSMLQSHSQVVPVSIYDEADIHTWSSETDITARLIQSICYAAEQEPALNAWFDTEHSARKCFKEVHLGLAMDTEDGLFVPVIKHAEKQTATSLREIINGYKQSVAARQVEPENLKGATITLSNFGKFAGRYASPIIVPPMVAILAVGRLYEAAVVTKEQQLAAHRTIPLSLSFDHRAVTGGEAARFLAAVIHSLEQGL